MKYAWLLIAGLLTGCGFHPDFINVNPPLAKLQFVCGGVRAPLCGRLYNQLRAQGYQLQADAPYRLTLYGLDVTQRQSPVGSSVNRQYYDVNAVLTYSLASIKEKNPTRKTIYAHSLAMTNANQLEGSQRQLQQIHQDLVTDLIQQLQLRMTHYEDTTGTTPRQPNPKPALTHSH